MGIEIERDFFAKKKEEIEIEVVSGLHSENYWRSFQSLIVEMGILRESHKHLSHPLSFPLEKVSSCGMDMGIIILFTKKINIFFAFSLFLIMIKISQFHPI